MPGKIVSMRDFYTDWPEGGSGVGVVLTELIDMGSLSPPWAPSFPRQGILDCRRVEKPSRPQASMYPFSRLLAVAMMPPTVSSSCHLDFLTVIDCHLEL